MFKWFGLWGALYNTMDIIKLIFNEDFKKIERLTEEEVKSFKFEGNTLLHYSALTSLKLSKIILPKFDDINVLNILNLTALHYCDNNEIKEYFIKQKMIF